jgi:hypothetical protein
MSAARLRLVGSRDNPNGRIRDVRWVSSTKALLNRTTQDPWGDFNPNAKWGTFVLDLTTNRETPFPRRQIEGLLGVRGEPVYSPDLKYLAWFDSLTNRGFVDSVTGHRIHSWKRDYVIDRLTWLSDSKTLMVQDFDGRGPIHTIRIRYESLEGPSSRREVVLPVLYNGPNPSSPNALNEGVALADNLVPGPWDAHASTPLDGKYLAMRWLIDRKTPIRQRITFALPKGLEFFERTFSSDAEWIAWYMQKMGESRDPELWISRYDGKGMRLLLSPRENDILKFHNHQEEGLSVRNALAWVPERPTVSFLHEGQLYLIDV